jgi:hypothetical protein
MQIGLESLVIEPKDLQGDLLFCKVIQSLFFINHFPPLIASHFTRFVKSSQA